LVLSPGQEHYIFKALDLLRDLLRDGMLLTDKACDADAIRTFARSHGGWANIPPRRTHPLPRDPICFICGTLKLRCKKYTYISID
jgi:transposase